MDYEVSVAMIIDIKDRILLQKKDSEYPLAPNKWSLVGGKIEENESPKECLKREVEEELGIDFEESSIEFIGEFLFEGELNGRYIKVNHNVFGMKFNKSISEIRVGEGAGFAFFEKNELNELDLMLPTKQMLEKFYDTRM